MWLEQEQLRRPHDLKRALHAGAGGQTAGSDDRRMGDWMVGVEGIRVGVGDQHVGGELADLIRDLGQPIAIDLERIVAEVQTHELGADGARGPLGLAVPDLLDALDRLALLLP